MKSAATGFYSLSDRSVHDELCRRFKMARLESNITQAELAEKAGVSLVTVKRAESAKGNMTLMTLIALLRGLGRLDQLNSLVPEPGLSPLQLKASAGQRRQRASSRNQVSGSESGWKWGDET